eukprot:12346443-Karenia_brevis.AAC.1
MDPARAAILLSNLEADNQRDFAMSKQQAEDYMLNERLHRQFHTRGSCKNFTPQALKKLVPFMCERPKTYLVLQLSVKSVSGFFHGATPQYSVSRRAGARTKLNLAEALYQ